MRTAVTVFTCHAEREGRPIGTAHIRQAPTGRRILRIDMDALPVDGGRCLPLEDVLSLAHEQQDPAPTPEAPILH